LTKPRCFRNVTSIANSIFWWQASASWAKKLGEERYAKLIDLAARAKALFAADPEDSSGKANEGRTVLSEIEDVIREVRSRRVRAKLKDDEGEVTGD
jgi:hypothetical protein